MMSNLNQPECIENEILLGLSISLAVYYTYLAIDPEGEIYVLGY